MKRSRRGSLRTKLLEKLAGIDEAPLGCIGIRVADGLMEGRPIAIVEPIARIGGQQLQLCALGQFCGLVDE